ncbi:hypothetical protein P43SY_003365 [Pythium insidiosum]|uniref:Uncharacterized protein n=1 Tax=Pythium insidiosum TaxID=114742 RepID=A0AAD5M037_PYTIN|nr:hypothetical protein P43SY_003365 [Pythium insidiosum]
MHSRPSLPERLLKRVRSPSSSTASDACLPSAKASKRDAQGSPRSTCDIVNHTFADASKTSAMVDGASVTSSSTERAPWPRIASCDGLRNAIVFLQNSRQHAMMLAVQNHWDRAMGVLEKVEKASESVCSQRRKLVAEQFNAALRAAENLVSSRSPKVKRGVQFCEDVRVGVAVEVDRSAWEVQTPVREEMLVLRASRTIPKENLSELW